ncbi:MAG TPA: hypothetical protein DIS73_00410 [Planctomycetia bacterium]|nr:MAG: hypothetical protein A3I59_08035 [Planctomycetes bacterium RIFCSPLOWO2_02_FULL_50_16]HCN18744.1 hypothetical protein [Planctomycetia bacterium]
MPETSEKPCVFVYCISFMARDRALALYLLNITWRSAARLNIWVRFIAPALKGLDKSSPYKRFRKSSIVKENFCQSQNGAV